MIFLSKVKSILISIWNCFIFSPFAVNVVVVEEDAEEDTVVDAVVVAAFVVVVVLSLNLLSWGKHATLATSGKRIPRSINSSRVARTEIFRSRPEIYKKKALLIIVQLVQIFTG